MNSSFFLERREQPLCRGRLQRPRAVGVGLAEGGEAGGREGLSPSPPSACVVVFPFGASSPRRLPVRRLLLTRFMAPSPPRPSEALHLHCSPLGPTPALPPGVLSQALQGRVSLSLHNIRKGFSSLILQPRPFKFSPLCIRSLFLSFDKCHMSPVPSCVEEALAGGSTEMRSLPAWGSRPGAGDRASQPARSPSAPSTLGGEERVPHQLPVPPGGLSPWWRPRAVPPHRSLICSARDVHTLSCALLPLNHGAMCFAELTLGFSSCHPLTLDDYTSLTLGPPLGHVTCVTFLPAGMQTLYTDLSCLLIPVCTLWFRLPTFWSRI